MPKTRKTTLVCLTVTCNIHFSSQYPPDDNHKPEMTIAITPFDGLCGFRPLKETAHFLATVPSLRKLVGEEQVKNFETIVKGKETSDKPEDIEANKKALRSAFTSLMNTDKDALASATESLLGSAKSEGAAFAGEGGPSNGGKELADLVIRLNSQFPGDIGLFVFFFLNYVKLDMGEAMFLKADDIHAYLSGGMYLPLFLHRLRHSHTSTDIIECMASSDNVVRAGFTPKFKDVSTLTSMLTYSYSPPSEQKMSPTDYPYVILNSTAYSSSSSSILYDPPIEEFSVVKTELNKDGAKATFEPIQGPSVLLCTKGKGWLSVGPRRERCEEGWVFFIGATAELVVEAEGEDQMVTFKAFCELKGKESML